MADDDQFDIGDGAQHGSPWDVQDPDPGAGRSGPRGPGRPWFGPKAFGSGPQPRTWQGWLITAGIVAVAVVIGFVTKAHHSDSPAPWALVAIAAALIIRVVVMRQRRR
jgi:hypothetical protein